MFANFCHILIIELQDEHSKFIFPRTINRLDKFTAYIGQIERGERNISLDKLVLIVNRLGVTVDYVLSESLSLKTDEYDIVINQLLEGRSKEEKILAVNMLKLMFNYTKGR